MGDQLQAIGTEETGGLARRIELGLLALGHSPASRIAVPGVGEIACYERGLGQSQFHRYYIWPNGELRLGTHWTRASAAPQAFIDTVLEAAGAPSAEDLGL